MRSTVVPAQITTVEDKITGNISVQQLLLLTVPIFVGSLLFVLLPPFYSYSAYKIALIMVVVSVSLIMAIRIRGRLVLQWTIALMRYYNRPRYYVFDKNQVHMRPVTPRAKTQPVVEEAPNTTEQLAPKSLPQFSTADRVAIEGIINNPATNLHFKTNRKGELYVHITETS